MRHIRTMFIILCFTLSPKIRETRSEASRPPTRCATTYVSGLQCRNGTPDRTGNTTRVRITLLSLCFLYAFNQISVLSQVEVGGLVCHVDLYAIRPQSLPNLRAVGSGEGSSSPVASTSTAGNPANFNQMVTPIPPPEDAKATDALFGTTFSVASQIKGLDGNEVIFYVFSVSPNLFFPL